PDGRIWVAGYAKYAKYSVLLGWDWQGDSLIEHMSMPCSRIFGLDVSPRGEIFAGDCIEDGGLYALDPLARTHRLVRRFPGSEGKLRDVFIASNGWVYPLLMLGEKP